MVYRSRSGKASSKAALKAKEAKAQAENAAGPAKDVMNTSLLSRAFDSNSSIEPVCDVSPLLHKIRNFSLWSNSVQFLILLFLGGNT